MKTNEVDLPEEFFVITKMLKVDIVKTLLYNARKKTATFIVKKEEQLFILKCIGEGAPTIEIKRFKNESAFYKTKGSLTLSPQLINSNTNYILIEYVNGKTLRERAILLLENSNSIQDENSFLSFIENQTFQILSHYEKTFSNAKGGCVSIDDGVKSLSAIYRSIALSGPFSTKRSKFEFLLSAIYFKLTKGIMKRFFRRTLKEDSTLIQAGFTHNDLHLDNIMTSNDENKVYIIDFANSKPDGFIIADFTYYLSVMFALLESNKEIKKEFIRLLKKYSINSEIPLQKIIRLSLLISQIGIENKRFNSCSSRFSVFKSYLLFPFFFYKELKIAR